MNDKLTISVSTSPERLLEMLEGVNEIDLISYSKYDNSVSFINIETGTDIITKIKLSDVLTDFILSEFEKTVALRIISANYSFLHTKEKRQVVEVLDGILSKDSLRRSIILNRLFSYIKEKEKLVLEGFLNFRLYEYKNVLSDMVDNAVGEYMAQKEYDEFISLLKQFVDAQSSMLSVMHVVIKDNGMYRMLNHQGEDITEQCFETFSADLFPEVGFEDIVISSLVYMSPEKIIIHKTADIEHNELLMTIDKVFEKRVEYCTGCNLCNSGDNGS